MPRVKTVLRDSSSAAALALYVSAAFRLAPILEDENVNNKVIIYVFRELVFKYQTLPKLKNA